MPFTARHQRALLLRFGRLAAAIEPRGATTPESGCVGNGTTVPTAHPPPLAAMAHYGHVDRALHGLPRLYRDVLALAYGDAGAIATIAGQHKGRRWRAVAPLTGLATAEGPAWVARSYKPAKGPKRLEVGAMQTRRVELRAEGPVGMAAPAEGETEPRRTKKTRTPEQLEAEEQRRSLATGAPATRWVLYLLDPAYPHGPEDRAHLAELEAEARSLLEAAQQAFGAAYVPCAGDDLGREAEAGNG